MNSSLHLILHGAIILFLANLMGFPLGRARASKRSLPETKEAWRMAHSANTGFGVFLLAVAGIFSHLVLSQNESLVLVFALIFSGYGFLIGTSIAALTGNSGLKAKGPLANKCAFTCYLFGISGSMIGVPLIIYGALNAF